MLQDYEFCSNFVTKFKNEEKKMKKILFGIMTLALMASCTESMEDRAVREAREYTEKVCPTPYINDSRTDSAVFDKDSRTYIYYLSLRNKADNAEAIALNRNKLHNAKLISHLLKGSSQLVWTTGWLVAAGDAFQSGYHVLGLHVSYQSAYALGVAVTTADKLSIPYCSVLIHTDADIL